MSAIDCLGFAAGTVTTLAFVPQLVRVVRNRSARDISFWSFLIFVTGVALWDAYGLFIRSWPIIIANSVTLVISLAILLLKVHYDRHPGPG